MRDVPYLVIIIKFFLGYPERMAIISCVFFLTLFAAYLLNRKRMEFQHWLLLASAIMWFVFAVWEACCQTMKANIRVDLLFIWPIVIGVSVFSIAINITRALAKSSGKKSSGNNNK